MFWHPKLTTFQETVLEVEGWWPTESWPVLIYGNCSTVQLHILRPPFPIAPKSSKVPFNSSNYYILSNGTWQTSVGPSVLTDPTHFEIKRSLSKQRAACRCVKNWFQRNLDINPPGKDVAVTQQWLSKTLGKLTLQGAFFKQKKKPYSPLGRLGKRLTSISLVLLAGSSFSS